LRLRGDAVIAITADVSNAIARYERYFGERIAIGEIPLSYNRPEEFVAEIDYSIEHKEALFGGEYIEPEKKKGMTKKVKTKNKKL
jgi:hypothetical protein